MGLAQTSALVLALALGVASCGDATDAEAPSAPQAPRTGCTVSADELGWVEAVPYTVQPGDTIELFVVNRSGRQVTFGVAFEFERLVDGSWEPATDDVYGGAVAIPEIAIVLDDGDRYGGLKDRFGGGAIDLPGDLEPGTYRAVKAVTSTDSHGKATTGRFCGSFRTA